MNPSLKSIRGQLVKIESREIVPAEVFFSHGRISSIQTLPEAPELYIIPPFTDAHVHIESSMLVPAEFARLAVVHGTGATVSDPHEIGNVLGIEGVEYMIDNGRQVPFKFYFGAPSCVPATPFETAGARISPADIEQLFQNPEVKYLAEMMNWPGVLQKDPEVMEKIRIAQAFQRPVDGHAPGLKGEKAKAYAAAGISSDHECFSAEEALDKLACGMKILIREGSAAKNFEALAGLLHEHWEQIMFCSDDKHPDNLVEGHINQLAARAVKKGIDVFKVLQAACINPVKHYKLDVGLLQVGDPADFILVKDLKDFQVTQTWLDGELVAEEGKSFIERIESKIINHFQASPISAKQLELKAKSRQLQVIEAMDGQLITNPLRMEAKIVDGLLESDVTQDLLKLVVVNRYKKEAPAVAFIKGFGFQKGAIASTVAHDSHNIIATGCSDEEITRAINLLAAAKGGVSVVMGEQEEVLPLPVAGLMSADDGYQVATAYSQLDRLTKQEMGSPLASPFMTLSFMALLVIPSLKLSDKGLFDGEKFNFTTVQA